MQLYLYEQVIQYDQRPINLILKDLKWITFLSDELRLLIKVNKQTIVNFIYTTTYISHSKIQHIKINSSIKVMRRYDPSTYVGRIPQQVICQLTAHEAFHQILQNVEVNDLNTIQYIKNTIKDISLLIEDKKLLYERISHQIRQLYSIAQEIFDKQQIQKAFQILKQQKEHHYKMSLFIKYLMNFRTYVLQTIFTYFTYQIKFEKIFNLIKKQNSINTIDTINTAYYSRLSSNFYNQINEQYVIQVQLDEIYRKFSTLISQKNNILGFKMQQYLNMAKKTYENQENQVQRSLILRQRFSQLQQYHSLLEQNSKYSQKDYLTKISLTKFQRFQLSRRGKMTTQQQIQLQRLFQLRQNQSL